MNAPELRIGDRVRVTDAMSKAWSPAQLAVFDAVESAESHLVVEALAGSGKTTTIVEAMSYTDPGDSVLAVAFNKSIATELQPRVPQGVDVATLHAYGLRAVTKSDGRRELDGQVTARAVSEILGRDWASKEARATVCKLVSLAKGCLKSTAAELDVLADAYDLDFPPGWSRDRLLGVAQRVLALAVQGAGLIDFDDMIWLPIVRRLPVRTYDWVFVDETQDLNPCQLALVKRAAGTTGRIVAVGDRRQAIYGFRGADRQAIPRMVAELGAKVLPLTVTYRCPLGVVREAARLVPSLTAAPNAPEGIVRNASMPALERDAQPGDFVISRTNAPLISLCYRWLRAGRRARIQGRDIGAGLAAWVRGCGATDIPTLSRLINQWRDAECKRLEAADRPTDSVCDKAECLHALAEGCADVTAMLARIDELFAERGGAAILLTSTHKAKGLEADRVWLLRDTYRPKVNEEEANLLYVAITRAKNELIYVSADAAQNEEAA